MLLSHELTDEKKVFVSRLARTEVSVVFCSDLSFLLAALYSILENICFDFISFFHKLTWIFGKNVVGKS